MSDLLTPSQRLAQAEAALHDIQLGKHAEEIEHEGRRVRYTRTTIDQLEGYIATLRDEIAGYKPRAGGLGVLFT